MTIKLFVGEHCGPCHEIEALVRKNKFETDLGDEDVRIIDVESKEGFSEIAKEDLRSVPTAKRKGDFCRLDIDQDTGVLIISCKKEGTREQQDQDKDRA